MLVDTSITDRIATISLNDPGRRNALSLAMFDGLEQAIARVRKEDHVAATILRGEGPAFCAGFDLAACVDDPDLLPTFIRRLSMLNRGLRRLPSVVIAQVHGAAIAGGCAMISACDFVCTEPAAKFGYPVHPMGISPAVTTPTLRTLLGDGPARALLMSSEIIDGREAHRRGLASHLSASIDALASDVAELAESLGRKGQQALRVTKAWLNELDGSNRDDPFDQPMEHSAVMSKGEEARRMLAAFWASRRG